MFAHIDCHYFVYYQLFAGALLAIVRNISFKTRDTRYNLSAIRLCGVIIYTTENIAMSSLQQSPPSNLTPRYVKVKDVLYKYVVKHKSAKILMTSVVK